MKRSTLNSFKQNEDELRKESKNFIVEYFDYDRLSISPPFNYSNPSKSLHARCLIRRPRWHPPKICRALRTIQHINSSNLRKEADSLHKTNEQETDQ